MVDVPKLLFQRLSQPQKRWTKLGEIRVMMPSDAGLELKYLEVLLPTAKFERLIVELNPLIKEDWDDSKELCYTVTSPLKEEWTEIIRHNQELAIVALQLVCFIFPRERLWEPK